MVSCSRLQIIKTLKERELPNFSRRLVFVISHTEEEVMSPNADPVKSVDRSDIVVGTQSKQA